MAHDHPHTPSFVNPLHAIVLSFPVALYPAALLADITYWNTQIFQWTNFAQWLIVGADFFTGLVLAWALVGLFVGRAKRAHGRNILYLAVVAIMFLAGVINAFQHSRDGWHSVGTLGIFLSIVCTILALAAALIAFGRPLVVEHRA